MAINLTSDNVDSIKFFHRIVAMTDEKHIYVLVDQKKSTAFLPLRHGSDCRFKCKNARASVKAALSSGQQVVVCDTYAELLTHCSGIY